MKAKSHPFRNWLRKSRLSYTEAAARCAALGHPTSGAYLKQIAIRWCRPGYDFAVFLSERLTLGEVTTDEFMQVELIERAA